eukprot:3152385-Pyramimonas_sp.AAC.1
MDAWADGAKQLTDAMERGKVYRITGAKKIDTSPRHSISRLSYYLRFVPPLGVKTKIEEYVGDPALDLPLHHPFTDFGKLKKVGTALRVSLLGVVATQPGAVTRQTKRGDDDVCNA